MSVDFGCVWLFVSVWRDFVAIAPTIAEHLDIAINNW